jgi:alkyl sulfatase BDS1-like metallo-beta-lactamase superfamily hydrolase
MNQGASLDTVIHSVKPPAHLEGRPYLQPVYDEPEYVVRNVWRFYGGWYDGTPSHLKPAPESQQGAEVARLAGGVEALLVRAQALAQEGDLRLACHLVDWALAAAPESRRSPGAPRSTAARRPGAGDDDAGRFRAAQWESEEFLES